jgi:hypothetical protein
VHFERKRGGLIIEMGSLKGLESLDGRNEPKCITDYACNESNKTCFNGIGSLNRDRPVPLA